MDIRGLGGGSNRIDSYSVAWIACGHNRAWQGRASERSEGYLVMFDEPPEFRAMFAQQTKRTNVHARERRARVRYNVTVRWNGSSV